MAQEADGIREMARGKRRWGEAEARGVVEAWRGSGERLGEFARRHDLHPKRLSYWVQRLDSGEPVRFHPVALVGSHRASAAGPIEIDLGDGRRVRLPRGFEAEDLRRVLSVLREADPC